MQDIISIVSIVVQYYFNKILIIKLKILKLILIIIIYIIYTI